MINLGVQANVEQDYARADTLLAQAAEMFALVLGDTHRYVSLATRNRSSALRRLGRPDEALKILEEQVPVQTAAAGPYDMELAYLYQQIAVTLRDLERVEEAEAAYDLALLHVLETSGENHPFLGVVFRSRAGLYLAVGQAERGLPYADSAIVAFERSLSRLHPDTRSGYRMRGEILAASGRDAEARTDLEEAYFRAREAGEPASDLESTGELLIGVYNRLGDRAGADSLRADR